MGPRHKKCSLTIRQKEQKNSKDKKLAYFLKKKQLISWC